MKLLKIATILWCWSQVFATGLFNNPDITTSYSDKLTVKNARNDSLIPVFDGEESLQDLFRKYPDFWRLETLGEEKQIATKLKVELVFVDGTQEEDFCEISSEGDQSNPYLWRLRIGLDFISGGSNTVDDHVQLCLQKAREELGVVVINEEGQKELILPQAEQEKAQSYRVNAELNGDQTLELIKISEEVNLTGKCPTDIETYFTLLELYDQVKATPTDPFQLNEELNPQRNGSRIAESCAFSREWNELYNESFSLRCKINQETCVSSRSEQGQRKWMYDFERHWFQFQGSTFLGISWGDQSVAEGGEVLHMRLIPLSHNVYLESYLNHQGEPKSLGLLVLEPMETMETMDAEDTESPGE